MHEERRWGDESQESIELPPGFDLNDLPTEIRAEFLAEMGRASRQQDPAAKGASNRGDPGKAAAKQSEQKRLQAFKKLVFDRRPDIWRVRQILDDPAGDHDWGFDAEVDLGASDESGSLVLRLVDAGRMD